MAINVLRAAGYLAKKSNWTKSNLELQKLIYIAHMFHLGRYGAPLIEGNFEAWDYGPVHPDLYHHVKQFGADPVTEIAYPANLKKGTEKKLLDEALDALSDRTGAQLIAITHWKDGAWAQNYIPEARGVVISNSDILEEYDKRSESTQR